MPDSIAYIEYLVGGQKVTSVRRGDALEVRVVFSVASSGGTIRLALQRVPGGAVVSSGNFARIPGTYYLGWSWTVEYTGTYTIKVDLFNDGTLVESKSFAHTVAEAPAPTPDSINYVEYWVGGQKVTTVKKGDQLEVRVVFTVASSGGTIRLALQRVPGGAVVSSSDFTRIPGTYYLGWSWKVEYTGSYTIKVDLFNDGNLVVTKSFPHTVSEAAPPPPTAITVPLYANKTLTVRYSRA